MLVKTVTTVVTTDSTGKPVDAIPVRNAVAGETDAAGRPVTPIAVTEDPSGIPVRVVVGKAAQNSAGQWVDTLPISGAGEARTVDVLINGATWPGLCAAMRAKERGVSVLVVEWSDTIGGMLVSGIQFTDAQSSPNMLRATVPKSSLSNLLYSRLAADYGFNQQAYFRDYSYASESKQTLIRVLEMLAQYGVEVITGKELLSLTKSSTDITVATYAGLTVNAAQYIDASYTSDALGMSGADYYLGGEAAALYGETVQSAGWLVTGVTQPTNPIDPYIIPGDSASGLIKYVTSASGTQGSAVPNKPQWPGFRLSITNTAGKKIAIPAPAAYNPADFELHRRDAIANQSSRTSVTSFLNLQTTWPAIPSKTSGMTNKRDANNGTIVSLDWPDVALITEYFTPGCTKARRLEIEEAAWQYTLGYLYFLANDSSVPAAVRTDMQSYGFVNDDYLATNGRPPLMYAREGIRAVGVSPFAATSLAALNSVADPIGLAYYPMDKHNRQFIVSLSGGAHVIREGGTPTAGSGVSIGARIPMKVLDPKRTQVSNLQVLWGMNCSQMAYNSLRVEPIVATLGEAAGIRAALAVQTATPVQDVPWSSVAAIQNLYGLNEPNALIITSDQVTRTDGTMTFAGTWAVSTTNLLGTVSIQTSTAASGTNSFTCTPTITTPGNYRVEVKYNDLTGTRGAMDFTVTASGVAQTTERVDQMSSKAGVSKNGDWYNLGTFAFVAGDGANNKLVGLSTNSGSQVNIAAVRFVPA